MWSLEQFLAFIDAAVGPDGSGQKRALTREEQLEAINRKRAAKGLPPLQPRERESKAKS